RGAAQGRHRDRPLSAVGLPRGQPRRVERLFGSSRQGHAKGIGPADAIARGPLQVPRLLRLRAQARRAFRKDEMTTTMDTETAALSTTPKPKKSVALSGVPAGNTALCTVGRTGNDLHYRGYDILDLAEQAEFEEIAYLLV